MQPLCRRAEAIDRKCVSLYNRGTNLMDKGEILMRKQISGSAYAALWRKMFSSYLVIIFLCFLIYSAAVVGESIVSSQKVEEEQGALYAGAIASLIDERIQATKSLSMGIDSSADFKDLYFSQFTGQQIGSFQNYQLLSSLRRIRSSTKRLDMVQVAVFMNGKKEVFTSDDLKLLSQPFGDAAAGESFRYGNLGELLELSDEDTGKFRDDGFVCTVPYAHSGVGANGTIAVVYDAARFEREVETLLGEGAYAVTLLQNGVPFYRCGEEEGRVFAADISSINSLSVELVLPKQGLWAQLLPQVALPLGAALLLGGAFLGLAYFFSHKYYAPISEIGALVATDEQTADTEAIVSGVKNLVGERDDYRKKIESISPFAEQRILREFLIGNAPAESLNSLRKPPVAPDGWYQILAINIGWPPVQQGAGAAEKQAVLKKKQAELAEAFDSDALRLWGFVSNEYLIFVILNAVEEIPSTRVYAVQEWLERNPPAYGSQITFGTAGCRKGSGQVPQDCQRAVKALNDGILMCGRGEIYMDEDADTDAVHASYYFPTDLDVTISHCIRHREGERLQHILHTIYEKNILRPNMDAETVRNLVEELRVAVTRGLHDALGAAAPVNLPKVEDGSTLEEIFKHYEEILQAQLEDKPKAQDDPMQKLYDEVERRLYDPELSLKGLAAEFGLSEKYVLQLFKKKYGETFLQYLQRRRIENARTLLSETNLTVAEVARRCGYTSDQSFRRNFVQSTSLTPGEYRSKNAKQKITE